MKHSLWVLALSLLSLGCAARKEMSAPMSAPGREYERNQHYSRMAAESTSSSADYSPAPAPVMVSTGGSTEKKEYADEEVSADKMRPTDDRGPESTPADPAKPETPAQPNPSPTVRPSIARMIIYAARLVVNVLEPDKSMEAALALMTKMGGFLSQRNNLYIEIRVPSALFFDYVREVEKMGIVVQRTISSEDVTEQFADLTLRLGNLKVMRTRLIALLELAKTVEDRLAIERELSRVNGEIDAISGRLRMLQNLVDFATIQLQFVPRQEGGPVTPEKLATPVWWVKSFDVSNLFGGQR
ncbi:MAG: hypothetical protein CVU59_03970 [Deltaproteobacteria bacterium HGW-Deltaproteobacteria-17]|nr:MAG: hypothetical protein CVU59_03970 [Deltaproteobacteria bacterium HGW-Deltaproteobacteria-17]